MKELSPFRPCSPSSVENTMGLTLSACLTVAFLTLAVGGDVDEAVVVSNNRSVGRKCFTRSSSSST